MSKPNISHNAISINSTTIGERNKNIQNITLRIIFLSRDSLGKNYLVGLRSILTQFWLLPYDRVDRDLRHAEGGRVGRSHWTLQRLLQEVQHSDIVD